MSEHNRRSSFSDVRPLSAGDLPVPQSNPHDVSLPIRQHNSRDPRSPHGIGVSPSSTLRNTPAHISRRFDKDSSGIRYDDSHRSAPNPHPVPMGRTSSPFQVPYHSAQYPSNLDSRTQAPPRIISARQLRRQNRGRQPLALTEEEQQALEASVLDSLSRLGVMTQSQGTVSSRVRSGLREETIVLPHPRSPPAFVIRNPDGSTIVIDADEDNEDEYQPGPTTIPERQMRYDYYNDDHESISASSYPDYGTNTSIETTRPTRHVQHDIDPTPGSSTRRGSRVHWDIPDESVDEFTVRAGSPAPSHAQWSASARTEDSSSDVVDNPTVRENSRSSARRSAPSITSSSSRPYQANSSGTSNHRTSAKHRRRPSYEDSPGAWPEPLSPSPDFDNANLAEQGAYPLEGTNNGGWAPAISVTSSGRLTTNTAGSREHRWTPSSQSFSSYKGPTVEDASETSSAEATNRGPPPTHVLSPMNNRSPIRPATTVRGIPKREQGSRREGRDYNRQHFRLVNGIRQPVTGATSTQESTRSCGNMADEWDGYERARSISEESVVGSPGPQSGNNRSRGSGNPTRSSGRNRPGKQNRNSTGVQKSRQGGNDSDLHRWGHRRSNADHYNDFQ